jgi:hypothetical protein
MQNRAVAPMVFQAIAFQCRLPARNQHLFRSGYGEVHYELDESLLEAHFRGIRLLGTVFNQRA